MPLPAAGARALRLYLVTDRTRTAGRPLEEVVAAALAGGVDAVQVREKDLPTRDLLALCASVRALCRRHGARFLVNDRVDVALACGAEGVHLPADSLRPYEARALLGPDAIIGVSTHALKEACAAEAEGADFVVFGPVFDTPSKRRFGEPLGPAAVREVVRAVRIPVLAIGGLTPERGHTVRQHGAHGVAVISSLLEARDPEAQARAFKAGPAPS